MSRTAGKPRDMASCRSAGAGKLEQRCRRINLNSLALVGPGSQRFQYRSGHCLHAAAFQEADDAVEALTCFQGAIHSFRL